MSKSIMMRRSELVWETRVAYFDEKEWHRTLEWLKTFADKDIDPYSWETRWAIVYNRVKDMTYEDVLGYIEAYQYRNGEDDPIVFAFKSKLYNGEEWEYKESFYDLLIEWLRDDCVESEVCDWSYADDAEEIVEVVDLEG